MINTEAVKITRPALILLFLRHKAIMPEATGKSTEIAISILVILVTRRCFSGEAADIFSSRNQRNPAEGKTPGLKAALLGINLRFVYIRKKRSFYADVVPLNQLLSQATKIIYDLL
jgi:hypothetical protein